jgi:hypothetical protein
MKIDKRSIRFVARIIDTALAILDEVMHGSNIQQLQRARQQLRDSKTSLVDYLENPDETK